MSKHMLEIIEESLCKKDADYYIDKLQDIENDLAKLSQRLMTVCNSLNAIKYPLIKELLKNNE